MLEFQCQICIDRYHQYCVCCVYVDDDDDHCIMYIVVAAFGWGPIVLRPECGSWKQLQWEDVC